VTTSPSNLMGGDCALSSTWDVAQESPTEVSATEAFTCDVGVTLRILKQNIQARTKGLASPLDYMKGFAKLPTRAHHRLIV
jgi:hypothetical protein